MSSKPLPLVFTIGAVWTGGAAAVKGDIAFPRKYNGYGYEAVQTAPGRTGTAEPTWPVVAGGTVVDGTVTWRAFALATITWQAFDIHVTGAAQPAWPTVIGNTVVNGSCTFTCRVPTVKDAFCPQSKIALWASSKLFAASEEIVRYSATSNPLGWTPTVYPRDAGFLPTGDQMVGEPTVKALAQFRGNLAVIAYSTTQIWQLDPDPARISLVDTIEGVGTPYARAHASVMGDLYLTTSQGIRSLSTAASTGGVGASDVGTPVDALVVAQLAVAKANGYEPLGIFVPGLNEFWLVIGNKAYVLRQSKVAQFAGWAEYTLPGVVTDVTTLDSQLYLFVASTGTIYRLDPALYTDAGAAIPVSGETAFARTGASAMTTTLESIASSPFQVQVRYNEANEAAITAAITMPAKSRPGGEIPLHLNDVPSLALVFSHSANEPWELTSLALNYVALDGGAPMVGPAVPMEPAPQ